MKIRTDFVTNSSSSSFILVALLGTIPAAAAGAGALLAQGASALGAGAAQASGQRLDTDTGRDDAERGDDRDQDQDDDRGPIRILGHDEALSWLESRGLVENGALTPLFWSQWDSRLDRYDQPPPFGLAGMAGYWDRENPSAPIREMAIVVDDSVKWPPETAQDEGADDPDARGATSTADADAADGDAEAADELGGAGAGGESQTDEQPTAEDDERQVTDAQPDDAEGRDTAPPTGEVEAEAEAPGAGEAAGEAQEPATPDVALSERVSAEIAGRVKPEQLTGINATMQLNLSGDAGGTVTVTVKDGQVSVTPGASDAPNTNLTLPGEVFDKLMAGNMGVEDGLKLLMSDGISVTDDGSVGQMIKVLGIDIPWWQQPLIEAKLGIKL